VITKRHFQNDYHKHFSKVHRTLFYATVISIKPVIIVINVDFPIPDDPVSTIIMSYSLFRTYFAVYNSNPVTRP
ncbi:hypothetical protein SB775_31375, partial [Peribacillus sp. SIMBA_075]|uniref:hypothetical protein n=1 Tax=Peribacillus sp. SIMBA_075 TaxID=3085813 RepID=UPI003979C968